MKKMFVVMEVKDHETRADWVVPINNDGTFLKKSRVIYADSMEILPFSRIGGDIVRYEFYGVSSSPKPKKDEWDAINTKLDAGIAEFKKAIELIRKMSQTEKA